MKTIPTLVTVIDTQTGKTSVKLGEYKLMPPAKKDVCQTCAHDHTPDLPHNAQSLYYQYGFFSEHARWPTWKDAMKHCSAKMKEDWERELRARGVWSEPDEGEL